MYAIFEVSPLGDIINRKLIELLTQNCVKQHLLC